MIVVNGLSKEQIEFVNSTIGITEYMSDYRVTNQIKKWQAKNGLSADGIIGAKTLDVMGIDPSMAKINVSTRPSVFSKDAIEAAILKKGYQWFTNGDYSLNIVGIRNTIVGNSVTNLFDDWITVSYKVMGGWIYKEFAATTDPGTRSVRNFTNVRGVARLVPNQYLNCYSIRKHQGKYEALCQSGVVTVYRDNNKDAVFDAAKTQIGLFGINIHKAGVDSTFVENWSAGCQVFKREADFDVFMKIVNKSASRCNKKFTYTLIENSDIS